MLTCLQGPGEIPTIEAFAARLSPPAAPGIQLGNAGSSRPLRSVQRPAAGEIHVWRAETQGSHVHSGALELPDRCILLLTGLGVHFHGTAFRGVQMRLSCWWCC